MIALSRQTRDENRKAGGRESTLYALTSALKRSPATDGRRCVALLLSLMAVAGTLPLLGVDAPAGIRRDGDRVILEARRCTMSLDQSRAFALVSLRDKTTGIEFARADSATDIFRLGISHPANPPGPIEWVSAGGAKNVSSELSADRATLVFRGFEGRALEVTCTWDATHADGLIHGRVVVTSGGTADEPILERVVFPAFETRVPLETDRDKGAVVVGLTKGGVYRNPAGWKRGQNITASQPGGLAAQFAGYYVPTAGLFSGTQDARGFPKTVQIIRRKTGLGWQWQQNAFQPLKNSFHLAYDVVLGTFGPAVPGTPVTWRDAADLHKAWARQGPWCQTPLARRTDLPDWLLAGPGMVRFSRYWLGKPDRIEAWLRQYWRAQFGDTPLIVALWGWEHVGSWVSPEYFPPYPSEAGFARAIRAIRGNGGHPFPWPSGYHWALDYKKKKDGTFAWDGRKHFADTAKAHTVIRRTGAPLIWSPSWLGGGQNAVLCRGDEWTRNWFNGVCLDLVKRGCDMIQVDQVVGGGMPLGAACFSTAHGHPLGPGLWNTKAFRMQLASLAAVCRSVQPGTVVGFEEPQELFLDQVGIQDYRDFQKQRWPRLPGFERASVFAYLYHEYVPLFQSNPRAGDLAGMAWGFVTGQVPHLVPHWPVEPSSLVRNPDFEEWAAGKPDGWERVKGWQGKAYTGKAFRDEVVVHSGKSALRLENTDKDQIVQISQNIQIAPGLLERGRTYRLSAWFRAETMAHPNRIAFALLTRDLKSKGSGGIVVSETPAWRRGRVEFTVSAEAAFLRIMIHMQGPCKVWVDDMRLDEKQADGSFHPAQTSGLPPGHAFYAAWMKLFHGRGRPCLLLGRTMHPPAVSVVGPAPKKGEGDVPPILVNAFAALDGRLAAALVNTTDAPVTVSFALSGRTFQQVLQPWAPCLTEGPAVTR